MKHGDRSMRQELAELLPQLRRFARALTGNPHDADDLVQVALEKALKKLAQLQPGSNPKSWVYKIMKNAWLDELRARARTSQLMLTEDAGESVGEWVTDSDMGLADLLRVMATLPDQQRLVASLVLIEGFSYQEAAAILEVPVGTVTSRLARARTALTAALHVNE